jgi:hypothetical protein
MGNVQNVLTLVFGFTVTFFVPAIVWAMLLAGLIQLSYEGIHRMGVVLPRSREAARRSAH